MDDASLLQGLRAGNEKAFETAFRLHYAPLCGFACKIMQDRDQAEEIVQELFSQLWERRDQLQPTRSLQGYLYNATKNACLNHIKHAKVKARFAEQAASQVDFADTEAEVHAAELQARINTAMTALPDRCKEIFEMSRIEGLKYNEIADKLSLSPRTVEVQIGKALRIMREYLREFLPLLLMLWSWKEGGK